MKRRVEVCSEDRSGVVDWESHGVALPPHKSQRDDSDLPIVVSFLSCSLAGWKDTRKLLDI